MLFSCLDDRYGNELWVTDGTDTGTRLVRDVATSTTGSIFGALAAYEESALFLVRSNGVSALRKWDGRRAAVTVGSISGVFQQLRRSLAVNGRYFYDGGTALAMSDLSGAPLMTVPRSVGVQFGGQTNADFAAIQTPQGERVVYAGINFPSSGTEPFITDGTLAGTSQLIDINTATGTASSFPLAFFTFGSRVLFLATTSATGVEWWSTDGTTAGTVLLGDLLPGPASGPLLSPDQQVVRPVVLKGDTPGTDRAIFMSATNASSNPIYAIFSSDGTPGGTLPMDLGGLRPLPPIGVGAGLVFFNASVSGQGLEIYVTDGQAGSTRLLRDFTPGTGSTFLDAVFDLGDRAYIGITRGTTRELWLYRRGDQSLALILDEAIGASPLRDILAGYVVSERGEVYFGGQTDAGHVVMRSDGTPAGTCIVARLTPSTFAGALDHVLTRVNSRIFLIGTEPLAGLEPRVIDLCPGDYDNSGGVSLQDLFDFLAEWFALDAAADFNNANGVMLDDLFDFLAAWFAGCN